VIAHPGEFFPIPARGEPGQKIVDGMEGVHRCLENRSGSEYTLALGSYPQLLRRYRGRVRWEMKMHFLKNLYRYPPGLSFALVKSWLEKVASMG
jgi:hypothetical protein